MALCDCNNFFVSCERLFRPDLEGRPVAVLSSNDGVVIARSNEVKALGVKMGEPYFKVRALLDRCGAVVFSSNFQLYEEVSARVMAILGRFTPSMEVYSIDEAFLEVPPEGRKNPRGWALTVREAALREGGIPLSVGVAPVKTAAKLAADRGKKRPEGGGVFVMAPGESWDDLLGEVPVGDVWGIGRRWSDFLRRRGITTALRLKEARDDWLDRHLGVRGLRTAWELRGIRCFPIEEYEKPQKSIQSSRTFAAPVGDIGGLAEAVTEFALTAGRRLREQGSLAELLSVAIATSRFRGPYYGARVEITLPRPTDSDIALIGAACRGLASIYKEGPDYERAEVSLGRLSPAAAVQLTLFDKGEDRGSALSRAADRLNGEAGRKLLQPAALIGDKEWRPKKSSHSGVTLEDLTKLPVVGLCRPEERR